MSAAILLVILTFRSIVSQNKRNTNSIGVPHNGQPLSMAVTVSVLLWETAGIGHGTGSRQEGEGDARLCPSLEKSYKATKSTAGKMTVATQSIRTWSLRQLRFLLTVVHGMETISLSSRVAG